MLNVSVTVEVRAFDGFIGPTGAQFLYPLLESTGKMKISLVEYTQFLRSWGPLLAGWRPSPPMRWRAGASLPVLWPTGDADQLLPR